MTNNQQLKTFIVIPTYNEAKNIKKLIFEIFKYLPQVNLVVVDDNSTDKTREIVNQLIQERKNKINLIHRQGLRNFAQSYIQGFKYGLKNGAQYIIQMDADFSHHPKYLPLLLDYLNKYDLVIGSRYIKGGRIKNWSLIRRLISYLGNFYARIITGVPIFDLTSGFNAWRSYVLKKIDLDKIESNGYAFQIELKFRAYKNKFKIKEIPIIFIDRQFGSSKFNKKIIFEAILTCLRLRFK